MRYKSNFIFWCVGLLTNSISISLTCSQSTHFTMDAAGHTTHGQVIEPAWHIRANPSPSSVSRVYGIPELLSAIFLLCVIKNEDGTEHSDWYLNILERQEYPRLSGKEAPLLLAHVCQRWRQTALNIPRLWAHIHIHFNDSVWRESWLEGQLSALRFWMKQSQAAPISEETDYRRVSG